MANPKLSIILSAKDEMTSNIDKARKSLEAIKNSGASAKQQLRALQQNLSELNKVGINSGQVFTEMAQYAGNLQDNIDDARRAISAFADDQFKIKAVGEALSLGTAAGSTFATTLELIGFKNDEVSEAIAYSIAVQKICLLFIMDMLTFGHLLFYKTQELKI